MNIQNLLENLDGKFTIIFVVSVLLEWGILIASKKIKSNKNGLINLLSYFIEIIPYIF